ncbi:MAG: 30S ribosomal protein S24e [Euryarchaeota archaeon]|jgi:small subunit ribosomal protein S24e|nr:30S ribosomal protein S24e [Euryarchaeota archaeon]|tara:strand:- start:266 stop:625 length:360 start_codon:yes stop_codon:yes gene_type:complete
MEIIERKENPVLDRVELTFQWNHSGDATPSLSQMVDAAAKAEPGADKKLVFVKNVNTRFGMSRTTGMALIYGTAESASIEPDYVIERHKSLNETESKEQKVEEAEPQEESEESAEEGEA